MVVAGPQRRGEDDELRSTFRNVKRCSQGWPTIYPDCVLVNEVVRLRHVLSLGEAPG
jgi:hypothetical protein